MKYEVKKTLRWGFIGCGEATEKKSGPAFAQIPGSSVAAVMSRSREKAESYARRHGISRWYTDAQQLIDDTEVNAVYIATPPSSHATYAIMAMKAGKPVYVEKPLASSYLDCQRINRVSEQTRVPCFVAYYRRYLPYFHRVRDLIQQGAIGKVISVQLRFSAPPRDLDYNSTNLPWRVQRPIVRAKGFSANLGGLYKTEDSVSACFQFASGLPGSGSWCFVSHESARTDRILVMGEQGQLSFSVYTYEPITLHTSAGREEIAVENPPYVQMPLIESVVQHLQGIGNCTADSISSTSVNWVMDRILGKI